MNSTKAPLKRSEVDRITNMQIINLFIILIVMAVSSATGSAVVNMKQALPCPGTTCEKESGESGNNIVSFLRNTLTFVILYNNLIPISLLVTLEIVKFMQAKFINKDLDMYHEETETYALARTSNLNEELGQIKYVFSDKTGIVSLN